MHHACIGASEREAVKFQITRGCRTVWHVAVPASGMRRDGEPNAVSWSLRVLGYMYLAIRQRGKS